MKIAMLMLYATTGTALVDQDTKAAGLRETASKARQLFQSFKYAHFPFGLKEY